MWYSRKMWGARKRARHPGTLDPSRVEGIALHWPDMSKPLATVSEVKAALRGWQNLHMDTNGWSDIAYQVAFDQAGNRYKLRGIRHRSAANGDTATNLTYGAALLILAPGEQPSPKMLRAVRRWLKGYRRRYPHADAVVGHGDIRPGGTECPGPAVRAAINAGRFNP